jgi:hypothetical protein
MSSSESKMVSIGGSFYEKEVNRGSKDWVVKETHVLGLLKLSSLGTDLLNVEEEVTNTNKLGTLRKIEVLHDVVSEVGTSFVECESVVAFGDVDNAKLSRILRQRR